MMSYFAQIPAGVPYQQKDCLKVNGCTKMQLDVRAGQICSPLKIKASRVEVLNTQTVVILRLDPGGGS